MKNQKIIIDHVLRQHECVEIARQKAFVEKELLNAMILNALNIKKGDDIIVGETPVTCAFAENATVYAYTNVGKTGKIGIVSAGLQSTSKGGMRIAIRLRGLLYKNDGTLGTREFSYRIEFDITPYLSEKNEENAD